MSVRQRMAVPCALAAACLAALLAYSQTAAFAWDEGYHVLAAQLIAHGRRPYLDFCFPQTPLDAYWNAAAMRVLGDTWREVHALAAVVTAGAVLLTVEFVYTRLGTVWAVASALLMGLSATVIEYGTTGQPYALCLFLMVAAFRVAVAFTGPWAAAAVGLLAGGGAASSLLSSAASLPLLVWVMRQSPAGQRLRHFGAFAGGAAIPFVPVLGLLLKGPRQVIFNLLEYHLFYRRANWEDATANDWKVLTEWLRSPQPFVLGVMAIVGWWAMRRAHQREFSLCAWLAIAVGAEVSIAHPTFEWYFILTIPFLSILAAAGLQAASTRVKPLTAVAAMGAVLTAGGAWTLYQDRNTMRWRDQEAMARKVDEVTPAGAALWADEQVYFLTRRTPAEGTELSYAEVIDLPAEKAAALHIVSLNELQRRAAAGAFQTVETCEEPEQINALDLPRIFRKAATVGICHVFWDPAPGGIR